MTKVLVAAVVGLVLVGQSAALAQTATGKAMSARRVREAIRLRVTPDNKSVEVTVDDRQNFGPLKKDQTFTTTGPVAVTIERPNPLTLLVTADVSESDDPDYATVGKLIEAMLAATSTIRPSATSGESKAEGGPQKSALLVSVTDPSSACQAATELATERVVTLDKLLFSDAWTSKTISDEVRKWTLAIDRGHRELKPGPAAIQAGIDEIQRYLDRDYGDSNPSELVMKATAHVRTMIDASAPADLEPACQGEVNKIYSLVRLTNPVSRLADITRVFGSITELKSTLEKVYANPANWYGPDSAKTGFYLRRAVGPSSQTMQVVTVKAVGVDYTTLDSITPVVLAKREDLVSASFIVKQYAWVVPEIGVGATFMTFARPKYATTTNDAGKTVVGESFDDLTVEPTVMMNFVMRTIPGAFVTPMAQIGVSTSKDTPTFFLGGGIRLLHVGKGDFAIGFGAAFPWVRQLQKLNVGDVVGGTKDIEDDLQFQRFGTHSYIALQYKF
jgi:hypothetical protein